MNKADFTLLLKNAAQGSELASQELYEKSYQMIKSLAQARMSGEANNFTFTPTVLVNEAYLKLSKLDKIDWANSQHFFAMASTVMRQILTDYARNKLTRKKGGKGSQNICFEEELHSIDMEKSDEILALDEVLAKLANLDERKAKIVELKYFGGFNVEEIASILQISTPTVKRDWAMAKSWLYQELKECKGLQKSQVIDD